jgi:hypothetical protein
MFTPAKRSRAQKPVAPTKVLRTAGGGTRIGKSRFASISLSDSDEDATPVSVSKAATVVKPVVSLAIEDTGKWGEDEYVLNPCTERWIREVESTYWIHKPLVYEVAPVAQPVAEAEEVEKDWADQEEELWSQPFAADLEMKEQAQDIYDCRRLTDGQYADFMTFLYEKGWDVLHEERRWVQARTGSEPPSVWVPPVTKYIPRFCREGIECFKQDCYYVHGDTIPKVKEECTFGAKCGASDPTGAKRALCIRMHPGETWTPTSCVHRHH